jgi:Uma2 family endonuclease
MQSDMPPATAEHLYTWEDFIALPEDDQRELLDGRLVEMDVTNAAHEWVVAMLVHLLQGWAIANQAGIVFASGYKVRIRRDRGFEPDVQLFRTGGRPIQHTGLEAGAPDLAVEVISPSSGRYDRVHKLQGYASIGVPEYWIVDPERQTFERLLLDDSGAYRIADALDGDATLEPASMPGLVIPLGELWRLPEWFTQ